MEYQYPIAEIFNSVQGEGLYAGTPMVFVRFAGCCVGKPLTREERRADMIPATRHKDATPPRLLPVYVERCASWDGREFMCDTDFRRLQLLTVDQLTNDLVRPGWPRRIVFTGGEPLMHDLFPLYGKLVFEFGCRIHIETSGVVPLEKAFAGRRRENLISVWVTVSPKIGCLPPMLEVADEIKLLVDEDFDLEAADKLVHALSPTTLIWLSPVNHECALNNVHVKKCIELLAQRPQWRISLQVHKILGVR